MGIGGGTSEDLLGIHWGTTGVSLVNYWVVTRDLLGWLYRLDFLLISARMGLDWKRNRQKRALLESKEHRARRKEHTAQSTKIRMLYGVKSAKTVRTVSPLAKKPVNMFFKKAAAVCRSSARKNTKPTVTTSHT